MTVTILRNASVLDAADGSLTQGQSVVVEGSRIADVGPGLTGPDDAVLLDVAGRTVMPGLIDAHTHPAIVDHDVFGLAEWPPTYVAARASRVLAGMLARGFTSIRDVGAGEIGLARAIEEGYFTGPRMFYGGKQLTQTGGVIAPGALADLLVVDGNPLDDIRVLTTPDRTLKLIMKAGQLYKNEL
jgi:imidazolonepropionase-like amidohydrolase